MKNLEIVTHEELPQVRSLLLDPLVKLTFDAELQEMKVSVTTTRTTATVQIEQTVPVSDLVHSARITDEGHVFPVLRAESFSVYISFDDLQGYLTACELCGIEPDSEVYENARAAEAES